MIQQLAVPARAVGGFFEMSMDTARAAFRRPFQFREFLDQTWMVARVSLVPTLLVSIPFTVLVAFTLNILLREIGAADLSGAGTAFGTITQLGPVVTVLVVAGAGATAICADLGARTIREEIDAMRVLGIDPIQRLVETNATLSALSEGLRGHGDDLGALLSGLNTLTRQANPKLPALQEDFRKAAVVANVYADAAGDLNTVFDNLPTINKTIVDQKDNLNDTLLATIGLSNNAYETLAPAEQNFIDAINRLRAPLKVTSDYSPVFGCLFKGIARGVKEFAPLIGVRKAGLFTSSSFVLGAPSYTYPESLPIVNASGGPNCRGLPDIPTKQTGGSFYRAPFLVTDNALIPYQPFTELQVDAPSTLQFLFNGAFAERDDF